MQDHIHRALEEVRGAWRFRWSALACVWAVCVAGWLVVLVLPDRFEATARVFVDPTTALRPVIQGLAVEQDVDAEINLVRQSLLSEVELGKIIAATGLDAKVRSPLDRARVLRELRDRIEISVQAAGAGGDRPQLSKMYTIVYRDSKRERSLKVVQMLLDHLVEGTLGGKREGSQQAQDFLRQQIQEYEGRLSAAEARLAEFKKKNVGMVPGEQPGMDYFARLQAEIDAVKRSQTAVNAAAMRHDALRQQLRGEGSVAASVRTSGAVPGAGGAGGDTLSRMQETQARLDDLLLRYTERHPDVIALRQTLDELKSRREREIEALRRGDPTAAASTGASTNPVYQSIQVALNQADIELVTLRAELADHQQKVAEYRRMLDTMPEVEAEYARLNRDYTVTKAQFTALAERLEKARIGGEADESGSVRFEIVDAPTVDFKPVSPRRGLLLGVVLVLGAALGGGLAYVRSMLHPVFYGATALMEFTDLKVLGTVSAVLSERDAAVGQRANVRFVAASGAVLVALAFVYVIASKFAPLRFPQ